jgi:hypothetical protein
MREERAMVMHIRDKGKIRKVLLGLVGFVGSTMLIFGLSQITFAATVKQKAFTSPDEAVKAFIDAIKANDTKEFMAVFGPAADELISSGDEVSDKTERERFLQLYDQKNKLAEERFGKVILYVGNNDWPFPIPITKEGNHWRFNTREGKDEILNRRIGRNELNTIQVCLAIVDAQHEYALKDWDGDGLLNYAERFISTKGKKDGLYWQAEAGEEESPLGPLVARAVREGYGGKSADKPVPYHGYFYRILKAQGKNAPGGEYDYVVKGKMMGGFAIVAYPAEYGNSGVTTFIVNQDGVVYQKNLGRDTAKMAEAMKKFDPDSTWQKVEGGTMSAQ